MVGFHHILYYLKPIFHLATLFARTNKKVGSLPTFSRRIFSSASFNQSCCRILVFASRRANKVAKWKISFILYYLILSIKNNRVTIIRFFASDYFRGMWHNVRYYSNWNKLLIKNLICSSSIKDLRDKIRQWKTGFIELSFQLKNNRVTCLASFFLYID